ncbi:LCP family protein [Kitasatospora cineracea]|uniref:LytR family transcriptional attenuator n=1 Tax=Kitasatospora cineracea TaxID=88074 RepID=A0A8G1XBQ0_9ACTN|nr:LCP family protein [Kitasatospora cineracea]ROR44495.1 LytR family transcriptional attenuator [Kitasatospora cineracea]
MTDAKQKAAPNRSRGRRIARGLGATAAALVVAAAGTGAWYYQRLDHNITTFAPEGIASSRPPVATPAPTGGRPVNILLLGSDTRDDGNSSLGGGDEGVGHSDTAILLHVYADHKHAVGVSIPRDTLVTIPPCLLPSGKWSQSRTNQMFNSAFTIGEFKAGNPACTQNTVEALTGLRVDHTLVVDFKGFAAITSAVGGVDVCVPNDVDSYGIHLTKGRQTVSGQQAVDYVRARHGLGDSSDIGRMLRQQAFMSSLIKKVQGRGFDLTTLLPLADAATRSLTVDPELGSPYKLAEFAQSLQDIQLSDIQFVTLPWRFQGARVAVVEPDASILWNLLRQDRTLDGHPTGDAGASANPAASTSPGAGAGLEPGPGASPSATATATATASASATASATADPGGAATLDVPVTVHNAAKTAGLAGRTALALRGNGYTDITIGANTPARRTTLIEYAPAQRAAAEHLAQLYPGAELRSTATDSIVLTLGQDRADTPGLPDGTAQDDTAGLGGASPSALPSAIPSGITDNTRPADADLCSDLNFG